MELRIFDAWGFDLGKMPAVILPPEERAQILRGTTLSGSVADIARPDPCSTLVVDVLLDRAMGCSFGWWKVDGGVFEAFWVVYGDGGCGLGSGARVAASVWD